MFSSVWSKCIAADILYMFTIAESVIFCAAYETETLFGIFNFKPKFYSISLTTKSESGSHARQIKSLIKHKKSNGSLHWIFRPWKQNLSSACEGVYPTLLMKKLFKKVNILFHKDFHIYRGMVFCYQNCSDLLWEKTFEIRSWRPRIRKIFEITRTIYSNSERSEQVLK